MDILLLVGLEEVVSDTAEDDMGPEVDEATDDNAVSVVDSGMVIARPRVKIKEVGDTVAGLEVETVVASLSVVVVVIS